MNLDLPKDPRILIVRLSALGDVLFGLGVVTALRKHFPGAHIAWLVDHPSADILRHYPDLDRVHVLPRRRIRNGWRRPWTLPSALRDVLGRMRSCGREGWDLVLDLQGNTKSGLFTGLTRGRLRVGHDNRYRKEFLNTLFLNHRLHPVPEGEATRHRAERDLGLVRALGIPAESTPRPLEIPADVQARAGRFVAGLPGTGPVVVLHPGTSAFGAYKRWKPSRFSGLADRLVREAHARVAVSWGPGEEALARSIPEAMEETATLFPPPEGLLFPAAVYGRANLVVGADSGPMHLAALMDTATLTLFGPKDPAIYRPVGEKAEVVWKNVHCSPCQVRKCDTVLCMESLHVEDVATPALEILARVADADIFDPPRESAP